MGNRWAGAKYPRKLVNWLPTVTRLLTIFSSLAFMLFFYCRLLQSGYCSYFFPAHYLSAAIKSAALTPHEPILKMRHWFCQQNHGNIEIRPDSSIKTTYWPFCDAAIGGSNKSFVFLKRQVGVPPPRASITDWRHKSVWIKYVDFGALTN